MTYLRSGLSALAALLIALLGSGFVVASPGILNSKAASISAVIGSLVEGFFTPWFWILGASFFVLFYACSRINSRPLRIFLFWTPVTVVSALGITILGLFTYLWMHSNRG